MPRSNVTIYTPDQVAEKLGVTRLRVLKWLRAGTLHGFKVQGNRGWRVRDTDLARFINQQARQGVAKSSPMPRTLKAKVAFLDQVEQALIKEFAANEPARAREFVNRQNKQTDGA